MIQLDCKGGMNTRKLTAAANRGSLKALPKAAAYIRGVARRKVRRRKRKSSAPGQPPFAHSGVFKPSILYSIDRSEITAFVGPQRLAEKRTNWAGQPVPEILEFGGMAALGRNDNWYSGKWGKVPNIHNLSEMANYFMWLGKGPAYWGLSRSSVEAKALHGGYGKSEEQARGKAHSRNKYRIARRYSPIKDRRVCLMYIKVKSERSAMKVARTVEEVFGYPVTNRPIPIKKRPFMGPSLEESKSQLAKFWQNTL